MSAKILDGKIIAGEIKENLKKEIESLRKKGISPKLVAVQVGDNSASAVYTRAQQRNCEKLGIKYELQSLEQNLSESEVVEHIQQLNQDKEISGIILQLPFPPGIDTVRIQSLISPDKDVEGVNPLNMGLLLYGKPKIVPCTAAAIMKLIEVTGINLYGKEVEMVGHSNIVGKPTSLLLLNKFATISICHIATGERGSLPKYVRKAEVLIVAVGKAHLIKGDWIREGAIVIDVGINRVEGKILGDVEFERAKERASWITPVPGGVGPLTTAMLLKNTVLAAQLQKSTSK